MSIVRNSIISRRTFALCVLFPTIFFQVHPEPVNLALAQTALKAKTEALLATHAFGCGALYWQPAPSLRKRGVSAEPTFMVAKTLDGNVLLTYLNVNARTAIYYLSDDGRKEQVKAPSSSGVSYIPNIASNSPIWQMR